MEVKAANIKSFIQNPPSDMRVILVYGSDRGSVSERVKKLITGKVGDISGNMNIANLKGSDISADEAVLFDEYLALPMFGGDKIIWLFDDGTQIHKQIGKLLDDPRDGNLIIIEGRDLKKTSALVKACIKHGKAASIACYQDNIGDVQALIREVLSANQLEIGRNESQYLATLLGNDHLLSKNELEKLAIYCMGQKQVSIEDIDLCMNGDAAKFSFDKLIDAICSGQTKQADHELNHFIFSGNHPIMIFTILRNHFIMLQDAAAKMQKGMNAQNIVQSMRPPIFFNRKAAVTSQINAWRLDKCDLALSLITEADFEGRKNAALTHNLLSRLITRLSLMAKR